MTRENDDDSNVPAGIEIASNTTTGKVDVLITELEPRTDDDGDEYTVVVADMAVEPHIAREWAFRLTVAAMEAEEAGLGDCADITDLELPE